jgi:hypothetical protein
MSKRYKLKLKRLDFISAVDRPAQETATALLIKRAGDIEGTARLVKVEEELGLVFCWAFTSKVAGADYVDLHGDVIDQDFIRACADFMSGARGVDEMHDSNATGHVVFAMPMTPEIAKAYGVTTDTVGLMVAIKPSADVLAKFKSGEYTGVSIAGMGIREPMDKSAKGIAKRSVLTTAVDGHTHLIYGVDDMQAGCTSSEPMPGSEIGWHSHPWVRDGDTITIGESMGHTHAVASSVAMRAPTDAASKSTTANPSRTVKPQPSHEATKMDPKDEQIATLTKRSTALSTMLLALAALPIEQRDHVAKLAPTDIEVFLGKSAAERAADAAAALAADPVLYKSKDGTEIRKSQGELAAKMAKQLDEAHEMLAKSQIEASQARLEKRAADEIGFLKGEPVAKVALLKALDSIADEKLRDDVVAMLKGADAAMRETTKAKGANPGDAPAAESPLAKFNAKRAEFAKSINKDARAATADFLATDEGAELYAAVKAGA